MHMYIRVRPSNLEYQYHVSIIIFYAEGDLLKPNEAFAVLCFIYFLVFYIGTISFFRMNFKKYV